MAALYSSETTKQIDQLSAQVLNVNSFELMQLAGAAIFKHVNPTDQLLIITGPGNNGGDGFVVAELARQRGQKVLLWALRPVAELGGDARLAAEQYQGDLVESTDLTDCDATAYDCVVDAIFGTGLNQPVRGIYADAIDWINQQNLPVLAVDIPSGLNGTTGQIEGCAVRAQHTVSILGRNSGLYTADGKTCCGTIHFAGLGVPVEALSDVPITATLLAKGSLQALPRFRSANSHKGSFGHVLTVGGQAGMMGAVLLAGQAVLRAGAGSTTVVTDPAHADRLPLHAPELMTYGFDGSSCEDGLAALNQIKPGNVLLLGMGLGQSQWSEQLFDAAIRTDIPMVIDADGLNALAKHVQPPEQTAVITPHPKEAAVLLQTSVQEVQADRWAAVQTLAERYQCVAVLKGSGTLISDGQQTWCCPYGNANLATAGSGDVLAGLIAGLMAQGHTAAAAACLGVTWHALAGEHAEYGMTLMASDLLHELHLHIP